MGVKYAVVLQACWGFEGTRDQQTRCPQLKPLTAKGECDRGVRRRFSSYHHFGF